MIVANPQLPLCFLPKMQQKKLKKKVEARLSPSGGYAETRDEMLNSRMQTPSFNRVVSAQVAALEDSMKKNTRREQLSPVYP